MILLHSVGIEFYSPQEITAIPVIGAIKGVLFVPLALFKIAVHAGANDRAVLEVLNIIPIPAARLVDPNIHNLLAYRADISHDFGIANALCIQDGSEGFGHVMPPIFIAPIDIIAILADGLDTNTILTAITVHLGLGFEIVSNLEIGLNVIVHKLLIHVVGLVVFHLTLAPFVLFKGHAIEMLLHSAFLASIDVNAILGGFNMIPIAAVIVYVFVGCLLTADHAIPLLNITAAITNLGLLIGGFMAPKFIGIAVTATRAGVGNLTAVIAVLAVLFDIGDFVLVSVDVGSVTALINFGTIDRVNVDNRGGLLAIFILFDRLFGASYQSAILANGNFYAFLVGGLLAELAEIIMEVARNQVLANLANTLSDITAARVVVLQPSVDVLGVV